MDFICELNRIVLYDNNKKIIAAVTFPDVSFSTVEINHTFVDESLRGQGIASKIMEKTAQTIRSQNKKAILTCSYAISWFNKHPEYNDILKQ